MLMDKEMDKFLTNIEGHSYIGSNIAKIVVGRKVELLSNCLY